MNVQTDEAVVALRFGIREEEKETVQKISSRKASNNNPDKIHPRLSGRREEMGSKISPCVLKDENVFSRRPH